MSVLITESSSLPADLANHLESKLPASHSKKFHIFGNGISFSISPIIHNAGFKSHELPYEYDIRESESIDGVANLIQSPDFGGASVTMPHKLQAHKYCNMQTETARLIGAINTLIVNDTPNGRTITGDNTDWSGLFSVITGYAEKTKRDLRVGLVIGAGGASRAALFALYQVGVKDIYITNRTESNAEAIRKSFEHVFSITVIPALKALPCKPDVIIGTIPAGKTKEGDFVDIFGPRGLCIDMAYKPRQTPLLIEAQRHSGWEIITGVQVLLAQAFDQYRLWTKKEPPMKIMIDAVEAHELRLSQARESKV